MKHGNRVMAEDKIKVWLEKYAPVLFWKQEYNNDLDHRRVKTNIEKYMKLYPHEFLFLISNSINRYDYVCLYLNNSAKQWCCIEKTHHQK